MSDMNGLGWVGTLGFLNIVVGSSYLHSKIVL